MARRTPVRVVSGVEERPNARRPSDAKVGLDGFDRLPPQNLEAEQCTLGAMMVEEEAIPVATEFASREDFYRSSHQRIYDAIFRLYERAEAVDLITVTEELRRSGDLEQAGGPAYLNSLIAMLPSAANVRTYAQIVSQKALLRRLITSALEIARMGYEEAGEAREVINKAEQLLFSVSQNVLKGDFTKIADTARETYQKMQDRYESHKLVTGIATGFDKFDEYTNGLQKSDLIVIAGRPSTGKTSLAMNIALHAATKEHASVAIFSLEMSTEQLVEGMLSMLARVDGRRIRVAHLMNEGDWERIGRAAGELHNAPILIDDTPGTTALDIRAKARRLAARQGVGLIIVDYLQLVDYGGRTRSENRNQELSFISRTFKEMARELRVPVVTLSQLSRTVERENRRPILSDLRDSGAIEAEADLVAFIHHAEEQRRRRQRDQGEAPPPQDDTVVPVEVILAKHRNGPTGELSLTFHKRTRVFMNPAREDAPPDTGGDGPAFSGC